MDQIEGGTLIVNKGNESKPKDSAPVDSDERQLNAVEGLAEGWKLAEVRSFCLRLVWSRVSTISPLAGKPGRSCQEYF